MFLFNKKSITKISFFILTTLSLVLTIQFLKVIAIVNFLNS